MQIQNIAVYLLHTKTHTAMNTTAIETKKIESMFLTMIKIEMVLSGNTFDVAKETVKEYLKSQGLM